MSSSSFHNHDPLRPFRLRPPRVARVSEISEATAASGIPPEERVNFHIGNPVQDNRLISAYLRIALGIDLRRSDLQEEGIHGMLREIGAESADTKKLEFLRSLITKSAPYTPRGGFAKNNPHRVVQEFSLWLQRQQDPLSYDLGQLTGKREIILASGGIAETVRVLLHALVSNLHELPATVFLWNPAITVDDAAFPAIRFEHLPPNGQKSLVRLREFFSVSSAKPAFLLIGSVLQEETRRALRQLSVEVPLMFIEANDAPNHLSLAREAKLIERVVRLLTPGIFLPRWKSLSTVFLAGNAAILEIFEALHFQLKGTPSASELELLAYLLELKDTPAGRTIPEVSIPVDAPFEGFDPISERGIAFAGRAMRAEIQVAEALETKASGILSRMKKVVDHVETVIQKSFERRQVPLPDPFAARDAIALVDELATNVDSPSWRKSLETAFLHAFVKHHPEYSARDCFVVSGSSRTALALLGFHCGIREVVIPDLSWSYEHCFPKVEAVPLTPDYTLDVNAIVASVKRKLETDPGWHRYGAVALNNPHNATGRVFDESSVRELVSELLELNVLIIDDLSYQDVAPSQELGHIKTIRQLTDELVRTGRLTKERGNNVLTMHSVSKTDCLAGARLAVVEIRKSDLHRAFLRVLHDIQPNIAAVLLTYLFYRSGPEVPRAYWRLRNQVFLERSESLLRAMSGLPKERNPFDITIVPPTGSMYPLVFIHRLPSGLSLDWLASGLAREGIGMLPLSTFARTEEGFETGRKAFRLTLGGVDGAETLQMKTRRVLIDLNRLIAQEASRYNRHVAPAAAAVKVSPDARHRAVWRAVEEAVAHECSSIAQQPHRQFNGSMLEGRFLRDYVPERLAAFRQRCEDRLALTERIVAAAQADGARTLLARLSHEFSKDSLSRRYSRFQLRLYDRTVHPTQRYSIRVEHVAERIIGAIIRDEEVGRTDIRVFADELLQEFFGKNVAISSGDESDELLLDLDTMIAAELFQGGIVAEGKRPLVSFWSDWDGSNRPSGQGHRLVGTALVANVTRMSHLLSVVVESVGRRPESLGGDTVDRTLLKEIRLLPKQRKRFALLLNRITQLTHQLEKRYRGVLPFSVKPGVLRNLGMKLRIARDPLTLLWRHNDRLERRMVALRAERRQSLEYYFSLNKRLRKQLHALLPAMGRQPVNERLVVEAGLYADLLQRMVVTPRIHENMITAQDSFAIDTTVHNIYEINEIAARYGNPGIILALQVSMSTRAEVLIALARKIRARHEQTLRNDPERELPVVRLIPLFEDVDAIDSIPTYLQKIWDYAYQSRHIDQETKDRFAEIIAEVFIAGSDISQQVGQAAGAMAYRKAKQKTVVWLAEHDLIDRVRVKMGSGEPMQRQGGYYAPLSGKPAFDLAWERLPQSLPAAARKSAQYATTPLMGVFAGSDLRTLQSTVSEQLRYLPAQDLVQLLHHLRESQQQQRTDLVRGAEALVESRIKVHNKGAQQLDRLTIGATDSVYEQFTGMVTEDFRQILYGRDEDVVGIHVISYFIARAMPQLRDRPTVRPTSRTDAERGQKILGQIAKMIPLSRRGSLVRAIAHNHAQTLVLGVNQLTTGLFRALQRFSQREFQEGNAEMLILDRILPQLPVYEILHSLRLYHDPELRWLKQMESAFPAGSAALLALSEDHDNLRRYVNLFQQELLRRHGLDVGDFFDEGLFRTDLLPFLRPDLAILLQHDLFNTNADAMLKHVRMPVRSSWKASVAHQLRIPDEIRALREQIWSLLKQPIYERVQSFAELAVALHSLSSTAGVEHAAARSSRVQLSEELWHFFKSEKQNDEMRDFLASTLRYLSALSEGMIEVPVSIIRSMNEVERIAKIEEQALSEREHELLTFYALQIARLSGDNG